MQKQAHGAHGAHGDHGDHDAHGVIIKRVRIWCFLQFLTTFCNIQILRQNPSLTAQRRPQGQEWPLGPQWPQWPDDEGQTLPPALRPR